MIITICIISFIVLVGFLGWLKGLHKIHREEREIEKFCEFAKKLLQEIREDAVSSETVTYILANYNHVSEIIPERGRNTPFYEFGRKVRSNDSYDIKPLVDYIQADAVTSIAQHERNFEESKKDWWNIFNHFYRGISILLRVVFGYPIQMMKPDFDFQSKIWRFISLIVTIISIGFTIAGFI